MKKMSIAVVALLIYVGGSASASPIFTPGTGLVSDYDHSATFSALNYGNSLLNYTEDNLVISTSGTELSLPDTHTGPAFSGNNYYPSGGNNSYITIKTVDSADMAAIEVGITDGHFQLGDINIYWETWLNGSMTGSGSESSLTRGTFYSFGDIAGISELRVAAYSAPTTGFGGFQIIGIDNLSVDVIPEPKSAMLMLLLFPVMIIRRNFCSGS